MAKRGPRHKSSHKSRQKPPVSDWHLWSEVTRSVSPLPGRPVRVVPPVEDQAQKPDNLSKPAKQRPPRDGGALFRNAAKSKGTVHWSPGTPPLHQQKIFGPEPSGIEPRMHRRLRRGQVAIDGTIDLHGLHQPQARAALHRFIAARLERGDRTILVITGKGLKKSGHGEIAERGVLRHMLPVWLSEPALSPYIAGWQVSAQHHGGEGAFYVRLKRPAI